MKKTTRIFIAALLTIAGPFVNAQKIDIKIDSLSELAVPPGFEKIDQEIQNVWRVDPSNTVTGRHSE